MNVNKNKFIKRFFKEKVRKEFPMLNMYILFSIVIHSITQHLYPSFRMFKPLPIILMIIYIHLRNSSRDHLVPNLVGKALILSAVRDLLWINDAKDTFIVGSGFFLIAHILYSLAFRVGDKIRTKTLQVNIITILSIIGLTFLLIFTIYYSWNVFPNKIFFIIYGILNLITLINSILRYQRTTPYSFSFVVAGSLLITLSNELLICWKFNRIVFQYGLLIINLSYYVGQYLIMHGSLHHSNLQFSIEQALKK